MTFKEELQRRLRESENTPFMLFITRYDPDSNVHYVFCESNDDIRFYDLVASRSLPEASFNFIPCNGKGGIFSVKTRLKSGYPPYRISYIVDADHDRLAGGNERWDSDTFVTDHYSVESYLIAEDVFIACLRQHTGLQGGDPALLVVREWFQASYEKFQSIMQRPMAATVAIRTAHGVDAVHLDEIALHEFVRVTKADEVEEISSLTEKIISLAKEAGRDIDEKIIDSARLRNARYDSRAWTRGKFLSWWFVQCFNTIAKKLKQEFVDQNQCEIRCGLTMSPRQFIAILAHHAQVPSRLKHFLARRIAEQTAAIAKEAMP